jgi:hypothetical protein
MIITIWNIFKSLLYRCILIIWSYQGFMYSKKFKRCIYFTFNSICMNLIELYFNCIRYWWIFDFIQFLRKWVNISFDFHPPEMVELCQHYFNRNSIVLRNHYLLNMLLYQLIIINNLGNRRMNMLYSD